MPQIPKLRVIIETEPNSGRWNMAVDESLLETAISSETATLRWYTWCEPTVSLGYFQKSADLLNDATLSQLPMVRRLSGGGAIVHDNELTYSITLPSSQRLFGQPQELYDIVHHAVSQGLREVGFPVICRGQTLKLREEPVLCFQRQDAHDVVLHGRKILGSAQRRRRGAILQHGSLIRGVSRCAKNLVGLADLHEGVLPDNLAERLAIDIAKGIAESWTIGELTESEIELAHRLCEQACTNP